MKGQVKICSVGDLMICDSPLYASVGVGSRYDQVRKNLYDHCKDIFANADIVIGNLEAVVHKPKNRSLKEVQMCCPEEAIQDLHDAGFNILHIANNHCLQHGTEGFQRTIDTCKAHGIQPIGERDQGPLLQEVNGIRLAFFSLCIHIEWYQPDHILYEDRIEKIIHDVKALRQKEPETVIVVSVHWGDEFATYPSNAQIALGHKLIDIGANLILGHHSHVYQGVEEYHSGIIAYSQGNFISDMVPELCRQTGILEVEIFAKDNQERIRYTYLPMKLDNGVAPVKTNGQWITARQKQLQKAVPGVIDDNNYWKDIGENKIVCHRAFIDYFKKNIRKYHPIIVCTMMKDYVSRKIKDKIGATKPGKKGSADFMIYDTLNSQT